MQRERDMGASDQRDNIANTEKVMYNIKDLQTLFGIDHNLAYKLAHMRGFPSIRINGRYYFPKNKIEKWIDNNIGKSIEI